MPRDSETKFAEDLTLRKSWGRTLFRRWGALAGGVLGAATLAALSASPAAANQPDPPDMVRSLSVETAPAACPTTAPAGTFPVGTNVKTLCERAVAKAPTEAAAAAIRYMFANLGAPYSQGNRYSVNPPVYDCSSFVARGYTAAGAKILKGTREATWVGTFGWTGAYMPSAYEGTNLTRMAVAPGDLTKLLPGDVLIQFSGSTPAGSLGNNGHAQVYLGDGLVIQSGGSHPRSLVNVTRHENSFSNEWYFRYGATPDTDPFYDKWMELGGATGVAGNPVGPARTDTRGAMSREYERARIYWSKETGVAAVYGGILQLYAAMGYEKSVLGLPTSDETDRAVKGSRGNTFQNGLILWSPSTSAQVVYGAIASKYVALGAEKSPLGLPRTGEIAGPFPGSRLNSFQGGAILWSAATGAHDIQGGMAQRYYNVAVVQTLGLPTSSERPAKRAGVVVQDFQRGVMYWSPTSGGAWEVHGGILGSYRAIGAELSPLGVPISAEQPGTVPGSVIQRYSGGTMYWSGPTGAHPVYGTIAQRFQVIGAERVVGLPVSAVNSVGAMQYQSFQRGMIVTSGSTTFEVANAIGQRYVALGGEKSILGLPLGPEQAGAVAGVTFQPFQRGTIYRSAAGAWDVYGGILFTYKALGAEKTSLGAPTSGEMDGPRPGSRMNTFANGAIVWSGPTGAQPIYGAMWQKYRTAKLDSVLGLPRDIPRGAGVTGAAMQEYQSGTLYWSAATGAHEVYGGIRDTYRSLGGARSKLGLPTSGEYSIANGRAHNFQRGQITWDARTGQSQVKYN